MSRDYFYIFIILYLIGADVYLYIKYHRVLRKQVGKGGYWLKLYKSSLIPFILEALLFPINFFNGKIDKGW